MEIYEKFSTEENSKQPIVILHPFNVMTDDAKKANNYIRNRTGRNIGEEKILKCCDGLIGVAGTYKDKNTGEKTQMFNSITEASEKMNLHRQGISKCINGKLKSSGDYYWFKVEKDDN